MSRSVTTAEAGAWLRQILRRVDNLAEGLQVTALRARLCLGLASLGLINTRVFSLDIVQPVMAHSTRMGETSSLRHFGSTMRC